MAEESRIQSGPEPRITPLEYEYGTPMSDLDTASLPNDPRLVNEAHLGDATFGSEPRHDPVFSAQRVLQTAFVAIPLIEGLDKFAYTLTDWRDYLAPVFPAATGLTPEQFNWGLGAVEIILGLGMAIRPRLFGMLFVFWLLGIIVNLLILGDHFDLIVHDVGLMAGAFALSRLSRVNEWNDSLKTGEAP